MIIYIVVTLPKSEVNFRMQPISLFSPSVLQRSFVQVLLKLNFTEAALTHAGALCV